MDKIQPFSGVISAIVSPFKQSMELDIDAFHRLVNAQKEAGVHGIVVLGSTGEAATFTKNEFETLVCAALEHQTNQFQILVGTGTNCTRTTAEKSEYYSNFKSNGKSVDGLLIVTPYYNKPMQDHLVYHFRDVCSKVSNTPVCVYNVPGRTGINMNASTLVKIAEQNNNVVAIKEAAGCVNAITQMRLGLNVANLNHVRILSGDDATFSAALLNGADGIISVTSQLIPKAMCGILEKALSNDWKAVQHLHLKTYNLQNGISSVTNPVGIKFLLSKLGFCESVLRAPLYVPNETEGSYLESLLKNLKLNNIQLLGE